MLANIQGNAAKHTFGDLEIPLVVVGLGVTGLKKTGVAYLLGFLGEGGRSGGVISCA